MRTLKATELRQNRNTIDNHLYIYADKHNMYWQVFGIGENYMFTKKIMGQKITRMQANWKYDENTVIMETTK